MTANTADANLVLAAEDFDRDEFKRLHRFSLNDERVIAKLVAHGPVLLQGSRGSGKSALMREASDRLPLTDKESPALAVYLSLRHMPLLRSAGDVYQRILCELLIERINRIVVGTNYDFDANPSLSSVQAGLTDLAQSLQKRIVLMFDDAAHIGREASLADFFDVFRTLSSSAVSCKATIYPGVTNFGNRFDVYNDATVVDVIRDEDQPGFTHLFAEVVTARFPELAEKRFASDLTLEDFSGFVGKSVLGNMRSFIFACNAVAATEERSIGLPTLSKCFLEMTRNFYWPLIDEVKPKLGKYVPVVEPAKQIAEALLADCGRQQSPSVIVHIRTYLQSMLEAEIKSCRVKLGEHKVLIRTYKKAAGEKASNLADHEWELANRIDLLVIFPSSPGSLAELGMFCLEDAIAQKMAIFLSHKHRGSRSFVVNGPVAAAKRRNSKVFYVDYSDRTKIWNEVKNLVLAIRANKGRSRFLKV